MFDSLGASEPRELLTLYTDSFIVRGTVQTRERRVTDILNHAEHDSSSSRGEPRRVRLAAIAVQSEYAQVNLGAVLFAVANDYVGPPPELRMPKVPEEAMISSRRSGSPAGSTCCPSATCARRSAS